MVLKTNVQTEMARRICRRRSLLLLTLVCISVYIFGKLLVVNVSSDEMNIYRMEQENPESINKQLIVKYVTNKSVRKRTPRRITADVNCAAILKGDTAEIERAKQMMKKENFSRNVISEKDYIHMTRKCDKFKSLRGYYTDYFPSAEESKFPIAYSILLYKEVEQAERLLRAIYTPNNYYCLHVDADSAKQVHDAIKGIAGCFDNVFVVSRKEYMVYAGFTRLQADLNCMENLLLRGSDWKYFINLPSQEFPLKTNKELVKILTLYNGANDIEGITGQRKLESRYKHRYVYRHVQNSTKPKIFKTNQKKDNPPFNITVVKGSAYGVFSREFVDYIINNKIARGLLDWMRDVYSPDEYYWATLNFNHHIGTPGAYFTGKPDSKPWLAVFAAWGGVDKCHGKFVRGVCIFGVGDLHFLSERKELFANKFYIDYQPYTLDCMEEWHFNRTTDDTLKTLNVSYYKSLPFTKRSAGR